METNLFGGAVVNIFPSLSGFWPVENIKGDITRKESEQDFFLTLINKEKFDKLGLGSKIKIRTLDDLSQFVSFYTTKEIKMPSIPSSVIGLYYEDVECIIGKKYLSNSVENAIKNKEVEKDIGLYSAGVAELKLFCLGSMILHNMDIPIDCVADKGVNAIKDTQEIIPRLNNYNVIIASAGMEAILPSVICSVTCRPVLALPSAVGYGYAKEGESSILSQLNATSMGIGVFNINNIFGACDCAGKINRIIKKNESEEIVLDFKGMEKYSFTRNPIRDGKEFFMQLRQISPTKEVYGKNIKMNLTSILNKRAKDLFNKLSIQIITSSHEDNEMELAKSCKKLLDVNKLESTINIETINSILVNPDVLTNSDIIIVISSNPGLLPNMVGALTGNDTLVIALPTTETAAKVMIQNCVVGIPIMPINNSRSTASFVSLIALKKIRIDNSLNPIQRASSAPEYLLESNSGLQGDNTVLRNILSASSRVGSSERNSPNSSPNSKKKKSSRKKSNSKSLLTPLLGFEESVSVKRASSAAGGGFKSKNKRKYSKGRKTQRFKKL